MKKGAAAVLAGVTGAVLGAVGVLKVKNDRLKKELELDVKNDAILRLYSRWMCSVRDGRSVAEYLEKKNYRTIAIYGMHYLGETLLDELSGSAVKVAYGIDKNTDQSSEDYKIYSPDEELPAVDAVVVTAFFYFDEIEKLLCDKMDCPVLSIEDILYEL